MENVGIGYSCSLLHSNVISVIYSRQVATTDKVLVDVGTGYWVEMSSAAGVDYCKRKVTALKENIEGLSGVIRERQSGLMQVRKGYR